MLSDTRRSPGLARPSLLLGLALAGCGGEAEPVWIHLAEGFRPEVGLETEWVKEGVELDLEVGPEGKAFWIRSRISSAEWQPTVWPRIWLVERPFGAYASGGHRGDPQLEVGSESFQHLQLHRFDVNGIPDIEGGHFAVAGGRVYVSTDAARPGDARLSLPVEPGGEVGGRWRVSIDRYASDGVSLWSGQSERVRCEIPSGSQLAFATASLPVGAMPAGERLVFRVRLDGEEIFVHEQALEPQAEAERHRVALPGPASSGAWIEFEVDGPPAMATFLTPRIVPATIGSYGDRPWPSRPDIVLFVADTFRADNLALHGSELGLTPNLDAFAGESVRFERAWAPSSWTLPSHASMFTGLWPHQHGADSERVALAGAAQTLAEELAGAGYRTVAITDEGFVSRSFGLDQGFEWFDERVRSLDQTLAEVEAALSDDDGRPLFLFVQTYRVHEPYLASEDARAALADRLPIDQDWARLKSQLNGNAWGWKRNEALPEGMQPLVGSLERLYRGGVVDLDRGFQTFLGILDRHRFRSRGFTIFTSDHGEAFGEHAQLFHATGVWEEHVRIPLLLQGPGLSPRSVQHSASLVDLPLTIAEIADLAPPAVWGGSSLLSLEGDRPAYSFQCSYLGGESFAAIVDGQHKLIVLDDPEALLAGRASHAYDLELDPLERESVLGAPWAAGMAAEFARLAVELREPALKAEAANLSMRAREQLEALGYAGGIDGE